MKNLHLIPTTQDSWLCLKDGELINANDGGCMLGYDPPRWLTQHIYITSDEEIKEGDWVYCLTENRVLVSNVSYSKLDDRFKIILTTDQSLDGVQAIDNNFLEWFVRNPSCEEVETHIVKLCTNCGQQYCDNRDCRGYKDEPQYLISYPENTTQKIITYCDGYEVNTEKIIIPKEEPKHPKVFSENGNELFFDKQRNLIKEEPKQETTFEEAACIALGYDYKSWLNIHFKDTTTRIYIEVTNWCKGAKWQQEQDKNKYSEEEVKNAFKIGFNIGYGSFNIGYGSPLKELDLKNEHCERWFEQFKKK